VNSLRRTLDTVHGRLDNTSSKSERLDSVFGLSLLPYARLRPDRSVAAILTLIL
jgi:hypothetical protein